MSKKQFYTTQVTLYKDKEFIEEEQKNIEFNKQIRNGYGYDSSGDNVKWDIILNDKRNPDIGEAIDNLIEFGKIYEISIINTYSKEEFNRELTLYDDKSTRKKATALDKWEIIIDDARNPDFEGLNDFLLYGFTYRFTFTEIGEVKIKYYE